LNQRKAVADLYYDIDLKEGKLDQNKPAEKQLHLPFSHQKLKLKRT